MGVTKSRATIYHERNSTILCQSLTSLFFEHLHLGTNGVRLGERTFSAHLQDVVLLGELIDAPLVVLAFDGVVRLFCFVPQDLVLQRYNLGQHKLLTP